MKTTFCILALLSFGSFAHAEPYSFFQIQRITLALNSPEVGKTFSTYESIVSVQEDARNLTVTIFSDASDNKPATKCQRIVKLKIVGDENSFYPEYALESVSQRSCVAP